MAARGQFVSLVPVLATGMRPDLRTMVKGKCKNSFRSEKTMHQAMDKIAKCEIKQELE